VNRTVVIIIVAFTDIMFFSSLNKMPLKAISSNKAGNTAIETMQSNKGKGEVL
jgi:hypothetical protein